MSNAKRRHRRRHRKHQPLICLMWAHQQLTLDGYTYRGCNGWFHRWGKTGPAPDWAPPQECLYVETWDCP